MISNFSSGIFLKYLGLSQGPMRGVCPLEWVSNIFFLNLMMTMLHFRGQKSFLMKGTMRADEVTRRVGNFVRPTFKNF